MQINDYTVANPSRVSRNLSVIEAVNETLQYTVSYKPFGDVSFIASLRFTWDAVSEEELDVLRDAFDFLTLNYVYIQAPQIGGFIDVYGDAMIGTLAPKSSPKIQLNQESVSGTSYALRSYTVEADISGYPSEFTG